MRKFEFALDKDGNKQFEGAKLPVYATKCSAGADFYCAEEVTIPSIWSYATKFISKLVKGESCADESVIKPVLVHTGIKANMEDDEVLEIYIRSSMPKKAGLLLANSVGIIDKDYYGNESNDGEIMFAYYNLRPFGVTLHVGDKIGQGIFKKVLKPQKGLVIEDEIRRGGFGSTDK